jgi:gephyrin
MQIRDSNRAMLLAAAVQHHCKVVDLGIAKDDEECQGRILDKAFASGINILITSGGVSMGDKDFIRPLLEKRGKVHFDKVMSQFYLILIGYSDNPVICFGGAMCVVFLQL